jgi:glycosyltransferase involved in cell wall biosynthesis
MNILFVHQNMPGQFRHLAAHLAQNPTNRVVFLTKVDREPPPGVARVLYGPAHRGNEATHGYVRAFEDAVVNGQAAAAAGIAMGKRGFTPDLVVAHPGWGESLYLKDVFPTAKLLNYCEFYYRASGADVGFDPSESMDIETASRIRTKNATLLIALEACDRGISPTTWQRSLHPAEWQGKIDVIFDGIDADRARPDPDAVFRLPDGTSLTRHDEVVTYVARNLEPYRGFPNFMRAIPQILRDLPSARVVIVGGDSVSYGQAPGDGRTWRAVMQEEIDANPARVHFLPPLPYAD